MKKVKARHTIKNNKVPLITVGVLVALTIIAYIAIVVVRSVDEGESSLEVTKVDIFTNDNLDGRYVTLKGVMVGMTKQQAIELLGYPDKEYAIASDAQNLEFGKTFNLEEAGAILQVMNDVVVKITLKPALNDQLHGDTKVARTKEATLLSLGVPEEADIVPWAGTGARAITLLTYTEKHLQFGFYKNQQISLSFII